MPSSNTHSFFCEDVLKLTSNDVKNKLKNSINYFKVFGQGPDPYFFYDFHLTRRSKNIYKINRAMQHSNVNRHFIKLINYINQKDYYDNAQIMAYLYGQICHFVLDSTMHPYIIYSTGMYDKKNPETFKYNGKHEEMEYYLDCYLIFRREKMEPKKYKVYKEIFNIDKFCDELNICISDVVKEVYNFDNAGDIYYKSIIDMRNFYYIFNYDRLGIKKIIYSILDFICGNKYVKKKELSFNINPNDKLYYLNIYKNIWNHPCDINEKYDLSFDELYEKAINKAIIIINKVDYMLKSGSVYNNELEKLFGNLDYGTGKDCNLNLVYKYFKF